MTDNFIASILVIGFRKSRRSNKVLFKSQNDRVDRAAAKKAFISKPPDPRLRVQRFVLFLFRSRVVSGNPR